MRDDLISREAAIAYSISGMTREIDGDKWIRVSEVRESIKTMPSAQPEKRTEKRTETHACDLIDRESAVDAIYHHLPSVSRTIARTMLHEVPSAQLGQRYTNEELRIFQHGISLSLLSKRSAQHWRYDENTATEIKFLERLYEKVSANMRGGQNE